MAYWTDEKAVEAAKEKVRAAILQAAVDAATNNTAAIELAKERQKDAQDATARKQALELAKLNKKGLSTGAVIGISAGVLVLAGLVTFLIMRKKK